VSVQSQEKFDCLLGFIGNSGLSAESNFWTSGNDVETEGIFVWGSSGDLVDRFYPVGNNQPDNAGGNENCVSLRQVFPGGAAADSYVMNDEVCDLEFDFICE